MLKSAINFSEIVDIRVNVLSNTIKVLSKNSNDIINASSKKELLDKISFIFDVMNQEILTADDTPEQTIQE